MDYYSRYIELALLKELNSLETIDHMKSIFARHGIPELLISDNGPQYASKEFKEFSTTYGFKHVTSSPKHAQANGAAERAVQTVKMMLNKESDPYLALLAYRTSPLENGLSPSELLMGRQLRTTVPVLPKTLGPSSTDLAKVSSKEDRQRERSKANYDIRHRAKELPSLAPGDKVFVPDLNRTTEVVERIPGTPRSYILKNSNGSTVRHNRVDVKNLNPIHARKPATGHPGLNVRCEFVHELFGSWLTASCEALSMPRRILISF